MGDTSNQALSPGISALLKKFMILTKLQRWMVNLTKSWSNADVIKLCQENNFNNGYFEGSDCNIAIDAYELKVINQSSTEREMSSVTFEV